MGRAISSCGGQARRAGRHRQAGGEGWGAAALQSRPPHPARRTASTRTLATSLVLAQEQAALVLGAIGDCGGQARRGNACVGRWLLWAYR